MTIINRVEKEIVIDKIKILELKSKTQKLSEMDKFILEQLYEDLTEFNSYE